MKNTIKQVFHSGKFIVGFVIFSVILLTCFIYPLINPGNPLEMIGLGSFLKPGTYVSVYDSIGAEKNTLKLPNADENRIAIKLNKEDRISMLNWLTADGIPASDIDLTDIDELLKIWEKNYDPSIKPSGMTISQRNYYKLLNSNLEKAQNTVDIIIATEDEEKDSLKQSDSIVDTDYVNLKDVANKKDLPLGTDSFGRDVVKELVSAVKTSLLLGLIAGLIATLIGLILGLLAGYIGGIVDDIIMFITNLFTVIPGFILLILISNSISQDARGATTVAIVIGLTSWVWTTRAVRAQVISLRNRDHISLSKISGHSIIRIMFRDILPYIASYVVMAFILQISSAILAEAQLSMLGLGPKTTEIPTLGLMMNWATLYSAHLNGSWWAYLPVILMIALISFSLNLMNTGLDQVFNPTLRD
jgi:peptide/nickel transport system permease protein